METIEITRVFSCLLVLSPTALTFPLHFCRGVYTGYLSPTDTLSTIILNAITNFENLRVAILTPTTFDEGVFTNVLKFFASSPSPDISTSTHAPSPHAPRNLQELIVNTSCTDEERAPLLTQVTGLSKLSIHSPTRAILELLPDWLRRLSDSLTELHLKVRIYTFHHSFRLPHRRRRIFDIVILPFFVFFATSSSIIVSFASLLFSCPSFFLSLSFVLFLTIFFNFPWLVSDVWLTLYFFFSHRWLLSLSDRHLRSYRQQTQCLIHLQRPPLNSVSAPSLIKDNCGSVTPGVLKSLVPLLERNIRSISIGLSYSLADEDVFAFLHRLPKLEKVELRYYWVRNFFSLTFLFRRFIEVVFLVQQLRPPVSRPNLAHLHSFTACHMDFQRRTKIQSVCKWIRRAISSSPIESLCILRDEQDGDDDGTSSNFGANISFRSIIDHLCSRHSHTLRVLDMRNAYIDVKSLRKLFGTCRELEEVYLCAGNHALVRPIPLRYSWCDWSKID